MRRFLFMLPLLAAICAAAPTFAQSDALNQAWLQTTTLINAGKYTKAEIWAKKAVDLAQSESGVDSTAYATSIYNQAWLYRYQGRYAEAEPLLKRSWDIRQQALGPDNPSVAECLNILAVIYIFQGRYADAELLEQRALAIREKALGPNDRDVAISVNNLAELYNDQGRYADAEPLLKRALVINEKVLGPEHPKVALSLNNLAELYVAQGRYAEAEPLLNQALAINQKIGHPDVALNLSNLAVLYEDQGRSAEAEQFLKRALAINEKTLGPEHPNVALSLNNLGMLYLAEGRYAEAAPLLKRSLAIGEKALGPDHPGVAWGLAELALLYGVQGRYADALPLIRRAAVIVESRAAGTKEESKGEQSELRSQREIFLGEAAVTAHLIAANDSQSAQLREEGFEALQWSKASDTAAAVSHMAARFAAGSDALANLVRQRQDTQDRFDATEAAILKSVSQPPDQRDTTNEAALRADADKLRQSLQQLDSNLAVKFPAYAELTNPKPLTIAETQTLLGPDQALIVFGVGIYESYVAVVRKNGYMLYIVPVGGNGVTGAVKKLRSSFHPTAEGNVPPFEAGMAYEIYRQSLAPAEPALKGVTQLYVVTDGALESLPLGVLLTAQPSADTLSAAAPDQLRAAPWLARRYAVSVLPSVSSLKSLRQFSGAAHAPQPFMGFGDPTLTPQPGDNRGAQDTARGGTVKSVFRGDAVDQAELRDLPSLPETAGELQAEAKLFNAAQGSVLLADAATVTAVKRADLASRRIIAFATHGLLAGDVGVAEPGLVLTPPANPTPADDGLLKASEIAQLKLNADLVILSACNTAASDGTPGAEGFSGLSKAFLYAGTRSLMVSHWSVVSDSTVALMTRMAALLEQKGIGRAEALRRAELALMDDKDHPEFAHPLFWAPFVVVGEGN
jgi:CHAT domain-containing protein/Flp pilus assembly protein TadD